MPRELYQPSHLGAAAYMVYSVCLYAIPAYFSYAIAVSHWAWYLKTLTIVPLVILAAYGINMMGFIGHEGTHGSLVRNRRMSAIVGIFFASAVVTYMELGFALSHWNHHRFTNQADDPDIGPVRNLKTWWQRLLFSRVIYNTLYFKYTWNMALGRPAPFKYKMAYSQQDQVLFARLNFLFAALWLVFYGWIFYLDPYAGLFGVLLPMLMVNFIGACQIYIDHAGLDDRFFRNAWSRTSPLMTILFFGANYHLEHHTYPGIPCYRLPGVHRRLKESGIYAQAKPSIVQGFLEAFKAMNKPYQVERKGQDFDAFNLTDWVRKPEHI